MALTSDALARFARWRLSDQVSLRDEEFGALAYHHGNRRLVFVKSRPLVELLEHLGDYESLEAALGAMVAPAARAQFEAALTSLAASEIIRGD